MKKYIIILFIGIITGILLIGGFLFIKNRNNDSNDKAVSDKNGRYLTIINETKQKINEVHVIISDGTEIEAMKRDHAKDKSLDNKSFSLEIPKDYKKYKDFTIYLIDNYKVEYKKIVKNVPQKGRVEVVITQDDKIPESDSLKNKIDRFFNGD